MKLKDKVAVVTGSTAGIGKACALLFAAEGAAVVVSDQGADPKLGSAVVEKIRSSGATASYCKADVRFADEVRGLIAYALKTYGRIDVLMNNACACRIVSIEDMADNDWNEAFNATVKAIAIACKEAIPSMKKIGSGSIINTSSIHGLRAAKAYAPYNALKAGIINLSRQIAVEYGQFNIRCNALCPGRILTEGKQEWLKQTPREVIRQKYVYPLGRPGTLEEIAKAALFLAGEDSSFVTGHALVVDGGLTAQLPDSAAQTLHDAILPG